MPNRFRRVLFRPSAIRVPLLPRQTSPTVTGTYDTKYRKSRTARLPFRPES
jgi:hypothetical protein